MNCVLFKLVHSSVFMTDLRVNYTLCTVTDKSEIVLFAHPALTKSRWCVPAGEAEVKCH